MPLAATSASLEDAAPAPPNVALQARRGARVLVVDDNQHAAELLAAFLSLRGYEVRIAHDGPEALQVAATGRSELALLDIGLPVMDGYELAARLKELPSLGGARFVAVTGYGQPSDRERSQAVGFDHHLVKPVDPAALDTLVGSHV